jgi:hypothetical protein
MLPETCARDKNIVEIRLMPPVSHRADRRKGWLNVANRFARIAVMTFSARLIRTGLLVWSGVVLGGCLPSGPSQLDEEKEPHFLTGRRRVNEMDYKGAIEAFEKALEVNPKSAMAHLELGCLFENEKGESDPVAAIYHYEKYLSLRARAENAEIIKQNILACKQELAQTVSLGPVTEKQQREFEQITEENRRLHEEVEKWRCYYSNRTATTTNTPGSAPGPARIIFNPVAAQQTMAVGALPVPAPTSRSSPISTMPARTHTIQSGETPIRIARRYGVKVEVLMAANPGVDARRLQPGQALNIPSP